LRLIVSNFITTGKFINFSSFPNRIYLPRVVVYQYLIYFFNFTFALFSKFRLKILGRKFRWGVNIYKTNSDFNIRLKPTKYSCIADPFLFKLKNNFFCFVERFDFSVKKGTIDAYQIVGNNFVHLGPVLEEPFHLSFPFLFEYNSDVYMCPESSESGSIRIYKATNFPLKWRFHKILSTPKIGVDPLIFKHGNLWWLFLNTDITSTGNFSNELSIYYSHSPLSACWKSHKLNPIFIDSEKSRNGGLLSIGKQKFRVGQTQSYDLYGSAISLYKIKKLNRFNYEELKIASLKPSNKNIKGVHHFSYAKPYFTHDFLEIK
jgi:hypothetical protein